MATQSHIASTMLVLILALTSYHSTPSLANTINLDRLVTSPSRCAHNAECPSGQICQYFTRRCQKPGTFDDPPELPCPPSLPACKVGNSCFSDEQCFGGDIVCNKPRGIFGFCTRVSDLLKKLGEPCTKRGGDKCDAARGLSCHWSTAHRANVCQQKSGGGIIAPAYCTPGNKLSRCEYQNGYKYECKTVSTDTSRTHPFNGFYGCYPTERRIPRGSMCGFTPAAPQFTTARFDFTQCVAGTSCEVVPNVGENVIPSSGRLGSSEPYQSCVKVVKIGGVCTGSKFRTQCEAGAYCKAGKCVKGDGPDTGFSLTHEGVGTSCGGNGSLPCAEGLECRDSGNGLKRCGIRTVTVKKGAHCGLETFVERVCRPGLICARNLRGWGLLRCRKPSGAGSACTNDSHCKGSLKCTAEDSKVPPFRRHCVDTSLNLPLGSKCTPGAKPGNKRCIFTPGAVFDDFFLGEIRDPDIETRCLNKTGSGNACQKIGLPFERCSEKENIGCVGPFECVDSKCEPKM